MNNKVLKDTINETDYYNKNLINTFINISKEIITDSFYNVIIKSIEVYYHIRDFNEGDNFNKIKKYLEEEFNKNIVLNILEIDNLDKKQKDENENENENPEGSISINTLFDELIEKIKENLKLNDDHILIKSIKEKIFPLYKDTYEFFIPKMPEVIKKFNIHLFKIQSNITILIELLKAAQNEI